jgi:DNA-binding response OmpR family regulator
MRPCFLVVDNEYPGSVSTRKLVLESAKLNVLTAYSPEEALYTLERFPNVDGVVLDTQLKGRPCKRVLQQLRDAHAGIPIVTVSPNGQDPCGGEQYHVSSFDPKQLLEAVHKLMPSDMQKLKEREDEISPKSEKP